MRDRARIAAVRGLAEIMVQPTHLDDALLDGEAEVERLLLQDAPTDVIAHRTGMPLFRLAAIYAHILQRYMPEPG